jgi:PPK2 family polyphosphate:nucleotide phosphotransferase
MKDIRAHLVDGLQLRPVHDEKKFSIGDKAAKVDDAPKKAELVKHTAALLERLAQLQDAFYADGKRSLLLVLQGRDASGKDGTVKAVCGAFNTMGVQVAPFGPPSPLELRHDFLWRVHSAMPPTGMIGVFNRSHYEDVLVVRVRKLQPEKIWKRRYEQINAFEKQLSECNTIIRKCFLHVSKEEQKARLEERLADPKKNWKFRLGDLEDRALWDDYSDAYRDVLTKCSTNAAPWYVVPSDSKTVRNYLVTRMLVETMEELALEYPPIDAAVARAATGFA